MTRDTVGTVPLEELLKAARRLEVEVEADSRRAGDVWDRLESKAAKVDAARRSIDLPPASINALLVAQSRMVGLLAGFRLIFAALGAIAVLSVFFADDLRIFLAGLAVGLASVGFALARVDVRRRRLPAARPRPATPMAGGARQEELTSRS
jgi:hypothetical protein